MCDVGAGVQFMCIETNAEVVRKLVSVEGGSVLRACWMLLLVASEDLAVCCDAVEVMLCALGSSPRDAAEQLSKLGAWGLLATTLAVPDIFICKC